MLSLLFTLCIGAVVAAAAKKLPKALEVGETYQVPIGLVHWFRDLNENRFTQPTLEATSPSKDGVEKTNLFNRMVNEGWVAGHPAYVFTADSAIAKQLKVNGELAIKERKAYVALMNSNPDTQALGSIAEEIWTNAKGEWLVPVVFGNSGFTRGLSLPAIILAATQKQAAEGHTFDPRSFIVPCHVDQYDSEGERLDRQGQENAEKNLGVANTWPDNLRLGQARLKASKQPNERLLRRIFGDGNGMKMYAILTAAGRHPSLKLIERIGMIRPEGFTPNADNYVKGGYIPAASIPQNAKGLREAGTASEAETWLYKNVFDKTNAAKITGKPVWESLASQGVEAGSPLDKIAKLHLSGANIGMILEDYPQLAKANCVCSLASVAETDSKAPSKAKAKA